MVTASSALHEGAPPTNVFTRHDVHGDTVLDADVLVIGSGAGGATVAAELAEAGFEVVVLEEGSYYSTRAKCGSRSFAIPVKPASRSQRARISSGVRHDMPPLITVEPPTARPS